MAPPRWSRSDVSWIVVVVMGICAGACCADIATDGNSLLTDDISETLSGQHTFPPREDRGQEGPTSELSTLAVSGTPSSKATISTSSEIPTSHDNKNISETAETTTRQVGENHVVEPGSDVPADNKTNNIDERSENKPTYIKNAAGQRGQNIAAAVGSTEGSKRSKNSERIVHVILFTSWQMIVAMISLEVFAYCVTIFIIFGFGRQRSRAKRFGHFSWKRPGPIPLEQETSFSTVMSREHHLGGGTEEPLMKTTVRKVMVKKPSVRGHRP